MKGKFNLKRKSKLVILLSLLCVTLLTSVGLATFLVPGGGAQHGETGEISLVFGGTNNQTVSINSYSISPLKMSMYGFIDPDDTSGKTTSTSSYKFNISLNITTSLTSNSPVNISLKQTGDYVGVSFMKYNPILRCGSYINYVFNYDEANEEVAFGSNASSLGFMNSGVATKVVNFSLTFTINDANIISDYINQIFEKVISRTVSFVLTIEIIGDTDA